MFLIFLKISPKLRLDVLINHVLIKKKVCSAITYYVLILTNSTKEDLHLVTTTLECI